MDYTFSVAEDAVTILAEWNTGARVFATALSGDDAKRIALSCNAHDELVEALLLALPYIEDVLADKDQLACFKPGAVQAHRKQVCAALAKAEGR